MSRRTRQVVSTLATVAIVLALWWLQDRTADDERAAEGQDTSSSAAPGATPDAMPDAMPDRDRDGIPYVALTSLPVEAEQTVALIDRGGPFPHPGKDGSTFANFEGLLPDRARGYYAEYTVPTPGLSHRGARRIVAGDGGELYWTEDHYESFERVWR